jgi:hypothetical protein
MHRIDLTRREPLDEVLGNPLNIRKFRHIAGQSSRCTIGRFWKLKKLTHPSCRMT